MADVFDRLKAALSDRYTIERELGSGGMATVYLAQDLKLHREVALKVLRPDLAAALGPERFLQEIDIAAKLNHPHILGLFDCGEADGFLYYVMPYIEGESLREKLAKEGELPVSDAVRILKEVVDALAEAHSSGVVHRDIKPDNIMLRGRHALVTDFGVAKAISEATGRQKLTTEGIALGTPAYMSPEQAAADPHIDHRSDIYAVGAVAYELLTGRAPFTGTTQQEILAAHVTLAAEPVTKYRESVPPALAQLVMKCLEKKPADRWQTAEELLPQLEALATPSGGVKPTGALPSATSRGNGRWAKAAVPAVLIVAVAIVALLVRNGPWGTDPPERPMVVVLPFENLGPPDDEYFAAGITDVITARLATISGLGVISRSSAVLYEGTAKTPEEIGEELGVGYILEGTIQRERPGDSTSRIRIIPQLIQVSDNTHVWAETYDDQMSEVFRLQSNIAERVARALEVTVLGSERAALEASPTHVTEAAELFVTASGYDCRHINEYRLAAELLERATELDPSFALAYAHLCRCNSAAFFHGLDRSEEQLTRARQAVDRALELDPDLPEAHRALGDYFYHGFRDYDRALEAYDVAARGLSNDASLLTDVAWIRRRQGAFAAAAANLEEAIILNPRSSELRWQLGITLSRMRRYGEAARHLEAAISLGPDEWQAYAYSAANYLYLDSTAARARAAFERLPEGFDPLGVNIYVWYLINSHERRYEEFLERLSRSRVEIIRSQGLLIPKALLYALAYHRLEDQVRATAYFDSAKTVLEEELTVAPHDPRVHASIGLAYAGLGRTDDAVREAEEAVRIEPVSRDAVLGPYHVVNLAEVLVMVGEHDAAIDRIEHLLSIPAGLDMSRALLRAEPRWDPLRDNPRFQELLEGGN
ncbi:protein kinase [Gemmatimonadota bacterium]